MSDIVKALRTYMLTVTDITNEVSTRIYYDNLPQNATLPAVVISNDGAELIRNIASADSLRRSTMSVEIYSDSTTAHADVTDAEEAVTATLEHNTGTWDTVAVRECLIDDLADTIETPVDGGDAFRRVRTISCVVWHT